MKRILIFQMLFLLGVLAVQAQQKQTVPEEKSIVNKEFDENGNLIKYDSTFVWQWNSDSTMNFSFDENFAFENEFPEMFEEFFNDSVFEKFGILNNHQFPPFNNEEFFQQFHHSFPDSMFISGFPFEHDSVFSFDFGHQFPGNFDFQELKELQKQLKEDFNHQNFNFPEFKSPKQQEEWEKLMKKQQKEKEELLKKWGNPQSKQN